MFKSVEDDEESSDSDECIEKERSDKKPSQIITT